MPEREQAIRFAIANDYDIHKESYYKDCALPIRDRDHATGNQWEELRKRGISEGDVEFLQWILKADPTARPTAQEILDRGWLDRADEITQEESGDTVTDSISPVAVSTEDVATPSSEQQTATPVDGAEKALESTSMYGLPLDDMPPIVREMSQSPVKETRRTPTTEDVGVLLEPGNLMKETQAMEDAPESTIPLPEFTSETRPGTDGGQDASAADPQGSDPADPPQQPHNMSWLINELGRKPQTQPPAGEFFPGTTMVENHENASSTVPDTKDVPTSTEKRKRQESGAGTYLSYR